ASTRFASRYLLLLHSLLLLLGCRTPANIGHLRIRTPAASFTCAGGGGRPYSIISRRALTCPKADGAGGHLTPPAAPVCCRPSGPPASAVPAPIRPDPGG